MQFKLGICQMEVVLDKQTNLEKAARMIKTAATCGAQLIALPEMFNCPYQQDCFERYSETYPEGETIDILSRLAQENHCYIIGGSIPEKAAGKIFNTCFVFDQNGQVIARHRKMHLFDIDIPKQIVFRESSVLTAGNEVTCFDTILGRFGIGICYDLRFPELFRLMVQEGVEMVFLPAAFNMTTGPAHWETLLRARAIDNQLFTAGICSARNLSAAYVAYGHSMVVDPWGVILGDAGEKETVQMVTVDLERSREVRRRLPLLAHRRLDLYQVNRSS